MENPASENGYEEAKRKARECYGKIGRIWCPALNDFVMFNTAGFHHLIWKRKKPRRRSEQIKRFSLISDAKTIIISSTAASEHRSTEAYYETYRRGKRRTIVSRADFWSFTENWNGKTITVVIRQFRGGKKHFFSVFPI